MAAITISRQMGSLGGEIARELAQNLGLRLVWREAINEAAQRAGAPELALHAIDELGLLGVRPSQDALRVYQEALSQVIHELASSGGVIIVGRAGQAILHDTPGVLHARIIAPQKLRAERLMTRHQITLRAATELTRASDHSRRAFLRKFYNLDWNDPQLYDLTINTARLQPLAAAALIAAAYSSLLTEPATPNPPEIRVD